MRNIDSKLPITIQKSIKIEKKKVENLTKQGINFKMLNTSKIPTSNFYKPISKLVDFEERK